MFCLGPAWFANSDFRLRFLQIVVRVLVGILSCISLSARQSLESSYIAIEHATLPIHVWLIIIINTQPEHNFVLFGFLRALDMMSVVSGGVKQDAADL